MSNQYSVLFSHVLQARGISKSDLRTVLTSCWARTKLRKTVDQPSSKAVYDEVKANGTMFDDFFVITHGFKVVKRPGTDNVGTPLAYDFEWQDGDAKMVEFVDQSGDANGSVTINVGKFIGEDHFNIGNVIDIVYGVFAEELAYYTATQSALLSKESFELFQRHKNTPMGKVFENIELNLIDDK